MHFQSEYLVLAIANQWSSSQDSFHSIGAVNEELFRKEIAVCMDDPMISRQGVHVARDSYNPPRAQAASAILPCQLVRNPRVDLFHGTLDQCSKLHSCS